MSSSIGARAGPPGARTLLNKVPEVTVFFWAITVLCATVGEAVADYLDVTLALGLTYTSYLVSGMLVVALALQLATRGYVPAAYWTALVLTGVVGTLVTDTLGVTLGVPVPVSTFLLTLALLGILALWWSIEGTLSLHTVSTPRREAFYWLAVVVGFALGAAAGDLVTQQLGLGYAEAATAFGVLVALVALAWWRFGLHPVVAFWTAFVLSRPLGAALGVLASRSRADGGLGLGAIDTDVLFLGTILVLVAYLSLTRRDRTESRDRGLP